MTYEEQKEADQPTVDTWHEAQRTEIAAKEREAAGEEKRGRWKLLLILGLPAIIVMLEVMCGGR